MSKSHSSPILITPQTAWEHKLAALPLYGSGSNVIPAIHVADLAAILVCVLENKPENFAPVTSTVKYPVLAAFDRREPEDYMDVTQLGTVREEDNQSR